MKTALSAIALATLPCFRAFIGGSFGGCGQFRTKGRSWSFQPGGSGRVS